MEGEINKHGFLKIKRGDILKNMFCPFKGMEYYCGDHCPLFSNPVVDCDIIKGTSLELCRKTLFFEKLTDERGLNDK